MMGHGRPWTEEHMERLYEPVQARPQKRQYGAGAWGSQLDDGRPPARRTGRSRTPLPRSRSPRPLRNDTSGMHSAARAYGMAGIAPLEPMARGCPAFSIVAKSAVWTSQCPRKLGSYSSAFGRHVRSEPYKDLSLVAQNPLVGYECTRRIRSEGARNQAKRLSMCCINVRRWIN